MTRGEAVNWLINITADIGKAEHRELWHYEQALSEIREMLESEPERKKGKWSYLTGLDAFECSVCGRQMVRNIFDYCPWCGTRMER